MPLRHLSRSKLRPVAPTTCNIIALFIRQQWHRQEHQEQWLSYNNRKPLKFNSLFYNRNQWRAARMWEKSELMGVAVDFAAPDREPNQSILGMPRRFHQVEDWVDPQLFKRNSLKFIKVLLTTKPMRFTKKWSHSSPGRVVGRGPCQIGTQSRICTPLSQTFMIIKTMQSISVKSVPSRA